MLISSLVCCFFFNFFYKSKEKYNGKLQGKQKGLIGLNLDVYGYGPLSNITEDEVATERANDFLIGWSVIFIYISFFFLFSS